MLKRWLQVFSVLCVVASLFLSNSLALSAESKYPPREWYVGKILFKSDRSGSEALYAVNPDGSGLQLLEDPNAGYYYAEALKREAVSADGLWQLVVRMVDNDYQIWQQDVKTSTILSYVIGATAGVDYAPSWAPDNRWIAYVSQQDSNDEIHIYDRQTGQDARLTNDSQWDKSPSFSADNSQIVFWSNREGLWKHIWLMNRDGSNQHNISGWGHGNDWDPVWVKTMPSEPAPIANVTPQYKIAEGEGCSPTANEYVGKILFKSDREAVTAFYLLDPSDGTICRVDDPDVGFYYVEAQQKETIGQDPNYRIFVRQYSGDLQIWQINNTSGWQSYIVGGTQGADYDPAWAPDNRYIAYVSQQDGNDEIHLYDRELKVDTRLTQNTWEWDKHPSWSADSKQIVFWSNRLGAQKHLWVMNADGSNQKNLSGWGKWNDWDPIWIKTAPSPAPEISAVTPIATGSATKSQINSPEWYIGKILFKSDRSGSEALYAMNPDGTDLQVLTDPNAGYYYVEAMNISASSPDGRYRLITKTVTGDVQIWQQDQQTNTSTYVIGGTYGTDYDPAWAPDTRWVAYVSQQDGNDEIHLFDRQNSVDKRLTSNSWEWDKHPSFSPDSSQIVFWSNRESLWKHIWVMGIDGSDQHNISGWGEWNDWDPVWVRVTPTKQ